MMCLLFSSKSRKGTDFFWFYCMPESTHFLELSEKKDFGSDHMIFPLYLIGSFYIFIFCWFLYYSTVIWNFDINSRFWNLLRLFPQCVLLHKTNILFCIRKNIFAAPAGKDIWTEEKAQHLRELPVLPEDHSPVPSTHIAGHSPL